MRSIRPFQLFSKLGDAQRYVHFHIPEVSGVESLTVLSLDTMVLIAAARLAGAKSILEVGTSLGYSALHFALNLDAHITTVDIEANSNRIFHNSRFAHTQRCITEITDDSRNVNPQPFDMVFLDANYSVDLFRANAELAFKCYPKVIAWHDYGCPRHQWITDELDTLSKERNLVHVEDSLVVLWIEEGGL